jgi:hypothetical protein
MDLDEDSHPLTSDESTKTDFINLKLKPCCWVLRMWKRRRCHQPEAEGESRVGGPTDVDRHQLEVSQSEP